MRMEPDQSERRARAQRPPARPSRSARRRAGHRRGPLRLCRAHPEQAESRYHDRRHRRSRVNRDVVATVTLDDPDLAQPQGARRRRPDDRQSRAQSDAGRPPRRADARRAPRAARGTRARADARRAGAEAQRQRGRSRRGRGGRKAALSQRRLPHLRRFRPGEAEADPPSADRRHRRASLRHGRALRLHLDRDGRLHRQYPRHLRHARSAEAEGSLALVDAGPAYRRRRDADLVRQAPPPASCAALRQRNVGELLARRLPRGRHRRIAKPKTVASYNYHPPFPGADAYGDAGARPIGGKRIALAIDEEDQAQSANEEEARRGRLHAGMSIFDVSDLRR